MIRRPSLLALAAMSGALGIGAPVGLTVAMKRDKNQSNADHDIRARDRAEAKRARKNARRRASLAHQHDREAAHG